MEPQTAVLLFWLALCLWEDEIVYICPLGRRLAQAAVC
jgi:hypothetical protein